MLMNSEIKLIQKEAIKKELSRIDTDLILVVVDSNVWQIYGKELEESLPEDKKFILFKCLEGEQTKSFEEFENGLEFFLEKGVHRKAHLVAIGGGATSDFGGFIASSILRGIDWSVVPTTLLSMVDASIGGKTGINSKYGKNLIGAFHWPKKVWIDISFLETLDKKELASGMGEVIKYGFLNEGVKDLILKKAPLDEIVAACAQVKEDVVAQDFKEQGLRMSLNLGHTFGHALERIYDLSHGESVYWGMAMIFKLFQSNSDEMLKLLREFEKALGMDFGNPPWLNKTFPSDKIMDYVTKDKKKASVGELNLILAEEVGKFSTKKESITTIKKLLEEKADELRVFNF